MLESARNKRRSASCCAHHCAVSRYKRYPARTQTLQSLRPHRPARNRSPRWYTYRRLPILEQMKQLDTVIGLEVHAQMNTKTKMFCGCSNDAYGVPPNSLICTICTGHPGTLPTPNKEAILKAIRMALAL